MRMFFLTPSGALALPVNRPDSEFAGACLARILLMLMLLLSNWTAYAAIGLSSIAPTSTTEIKMSSCGVDVTGTAKDYYNNALPWGVAGTLNTAIDVVTGIGHMPAAIGHLGEGTGRFSADPSWRNAGGIVSDALVVGSVLSATASALPSLNGSAAAANTSVPRVRHYTSPQGMAGIADDMAVNPSRGSPVGVHVEIQPFGSTATGAAETGAASRGAYVEFNAPSSMLPTTVGPRNTAVIPTSGPLPLQNLNPTFHKVPWYLSGGH